MKKIILFLMAAGVVQIAQAKPSCLITTNSIAGVRVGMTLKQAIAQVPKAKLEMDWDGEGINYLAMRLPGADEQLLWLLPDDDLSEKQDLKRLPLKSKVNYLQTFNTACRNKEGYGPGVPLAKMLKAYGGFKDIEMSEIESREFVSFAAQPSEYSFQIDHTGIYKQGQRHTKRFQKNATILSVTVTPPY